jgi:hypothetical protein
MTNIEVIKAAYLEWQERDDSLIDNTEEEQRLMFLSDQIMGLATYDDNLDIEFGKMFLETIIVIENGTTFEYIKDHENHKKYIMSCNFLKKCIEYGTSIRGAWFNYHDGKIYPDYWLGNIEGSPHDDYIQIDQVFMTWFINFLQNKEEN